MGPTVMLVAAHNVSKRYASGDSVVEALCDLSLEVAAGQFVALMGASGSGKSTLLHLLGGLDRPTAGEIVIESRPLAAMSDRQRTLFRRRRIGVVFQAFNLLPALTAEENVALPLLVDGCPNGEIRNRVDAALERVDLKHRRRHRPEALSGGEQQRVAIARALVNEPAVILADEPTGNLDSAHARTIWTLLRRLVDQHGRTLVAVTHEATSAAYADRIVVLCDGRNVGEFEPDESRDAALVAHRYQELAG